MIQYGSRFIKYQAEGRNKTVFDAFNGLFANMSVARKLFRLFKSFNEYVKIKGLAKQDIPQFDKVLGILTRLAFMCYWFFDNLAVLIKVKFLQTLDLKSTARKASKCWLAGILLGIFAALYNMVTDARKEAELLILRSKVKKENTTQEGAAADEAHIKAELQKLRAKKRTNLINLIKNCGDCITASQSLGYP